MTVKNGGPDVRACEAVLIPFDKWSMPLRYRVKHGLVSERRTNNGHCRSLQTKTL